VAPLEYTTSGAAVGTGNDDDDDRNLMFVVIDVADACAGRPSTAMVSKSDASSALAVAGHRPLRLSRTLVIGLFSPAEAIPRTRYPATSGVATTLLMTVWVSTSATGLCPRTARPIRHDGLGGVPAGQLTGPDVASAVYDVGGGRAGACTGIGEVAVDVDLRRGDADQHLFGRNPAAHRRAGTRWPRFRRRCSCSPGRHRRRHTLRCTGRDGTPWTHSEGLGR
jgi:hypothetical protein